MGKGTLAPDQLKQVHAWLKEKWKGNSNCFVCGVNQWDIQVDLVVTPIITKGNIQIGGTTYPHVVCACHNCGHTVFFNAVMMGLFKEENTDDLETVEKENG